MNTLAALRGPRASAFSTKLALLLIVSILFWATGMPTFLNYSKAAALQNFSDTITDSDRGATADHLIAATTTAALDAGDTIVVTFDPASTTAFTLGAIDSGDINGTNVTLTAVCGGGATDEVTVGVAGRVITFTVCTGDSIAAGPIAFDIVGDLITNPMIAGSYVIRMETFDGGTVELDSGDTRIAIIDDVVVTASVDTTFTFTVAGVATTTDVNGADTTRTSTATALDFGTLVPGVSSIMAQNLTVETNAYNGFVVTVEQDQNLQSNTGADIDLFVDGTAVGTPEAWAGPDGTLGFGENGWGHFGITSSDASLTAGDEFDDNLWAGNFDSAREVFYHNGPADGATAHMGAATVGYQIQISSLQEAGNDYTNTIFYVATPTF